MSSRERLSKERYEHAEKLMRHRRPTLVPGELLTPNWHGETLWFDVGPETLLVDPVASTTRAAYDRERAALPLREATGLELSELTVSDVDPVDDVVSFTHENDEHELRGWQLSLADYTVLPRPGPTRTPWERPSPDGRWVAFVRDHDVWVRSRADGEERALTSDGTPDQCYAECPDTGQRRPLHEILGSRMAPALLWSSDSRRVLTHRLDQRGVRMTTLVHASPSPDGPPRYDHYRYPLPGDDIVPTGQLLSIEVESGAITWAAHEPVLLQLLQYSAPTFRGELWFAGDDVAYFLSRSRDVREISLCRFDLGTGRVRTVLTETDPLRVELNPTSAELPIVRVLPGRGEVLWWSQRDGHGHLYRYDEDGHLLGRLTSGDWVVRQILHVDADESMALVVTAGRTPDDPYVRQLLEIDLSNGSIRTVVEDDLDHEFSASPSGRYVVDRASRTDVAPVTTVIEVRTGAAHEVHRVDPSPLIALGWSPPIRFSVLAADGRTPLWGTLTVPHGLDETRSYPLIDDLYPGPQQNRSSPAWRAPFHIQDMDSLASLGIATMTLDGRGTPGRSRAFHRFSYGNLADAGCVADHVSAIHQLAERHPWIDLGRVGAKGHSGGGRATVRSMLTAPELYRVGAAWGGTQDERFYQSYWLEGYQGPRDEDDWAEVSNPALAGRLQGSLFLAHGELDDNVLLSQTIRLISALTDANKDYELVLLPGTEHGFAGRRAYLYRRTWDFLVRHLLEMDPPEGVELTEPPLLMDAPAFLRC
ncbi:S9 family peptidase [Jiangella endophytica]|uniref:S9 family peptidase n=1 Tax=Jiangella endophytica TaxID=1623398 RepID=UPI000E350696|nr:DPP IV N-terminal domain-containing protein [Jiangella endophytica]